MMIAALFVQTDGSYFGLECVDPWDIHRDATKYHGPWPVVAHPPCARWCMLAKLNESRYKDTTGWKACEDGGLFESALNSVNRFGGVLEHPAYTMAWKKYGLARPVPGSWQRSGIGWVTQVAQVAYGHRARKRTWLYYRGTAEPFAMNWTETNGTHGHIGPGSLVKKMSKRERLHTPTRFRDELVYLAVNSRL